MGSYQNHGLNRFNGLWLLMSIAISQICLGFNGLASGENPLNLRVIQDPLIRLTQVSEVNEVNEVNEVKEVKGRCHWDVVYFSALNRTAKLLSFNFPNASTAS